MKQKFNIKRISICLLTFLCMFLATTEVKAENNLGQIADDLKEEAGITTCKYVEYGTSNIVAELSFNSTDMILINKINDNSNVAVNKILKNAKFSPQFKLSDLKGECPSLIFLGELDENLNVPAKLENFDGATMKLGKKSTWDDIKDTITDAENGNYNPEDYKTCEYAKNDPNKVLIKLIIGPDKVSLINEFKTEGIEFDSFKQFEFVTFEPQFGVSDVNGKCPNSLYVGDADKVFVSKVKLENFNGATKVGLVVKSSDTTNDMTNQDVQEVICEGKTVEIVSSIFNLIRFLVPIIIIILSIINFIGVVISGENDKMEKAKKNFIIRLLIGFAILIVPSLLELILKLAGLIETDLVEVTCKLFK